MLSNLTVIIFHASQKNVITTDVEERLSPQKAGGRNLGIRVDVFIFVQDL